MDLNIKINSLLIEELDAESGKLMAYSKTQWTKKERPTCKSYEDVFKTLDEEIKQRSGYVTHKMKMLVTVRTNKGRFVRIY